MFSKIIVNLFILAVLFTAPFLIPIYNINYDISSLFSAVTILFAILIGFFILTTTTNHFNLQSLITEENSGLITFFQLAKLIQPSSVEKISEAIDHYQIKALNFPLIDYIENTRIEFNQIVSHIDAIEPTNEKGFALIQYLHQKKDQTIKVREGIFIASKKVISLRHWVTIIFLVLSLIFLVFLLRNGFWVLNLFTGLYGISVYLLLVLLKELDDNSFLENILSYKAAQNVFLEIGRLKYFPPFAVKNRIITEQKEDYRMGIYKNYPVSLETEIKIVASKK